MTGDWAVRLRDTLSAAGIPARTDAPFGALTTYGVGGGCSLLVEVASRTDAETVARALAGADGGTLPVYVLGNGSNTLVADAGFDGVVVRVVQSRAEEDLPLRVSVDRVEADGWMPLPLLARRSVAAGACGLEWAVGVPGTVGGAVRMNAGGHGAEVVDSLVSARVLSLRTGACADFPAGELGLHFRGSALGDGHLVLSAVFSVCGPGGHDCAGEIASIVGWRRSHQPGGRNAGSVFVNPAPGEGSSGAIIDAAGLRGATVGGASVSEKHANFIQAGPGATAADVVGLMAAVQDAVRDRTGITLRSEVRLVGFDDRVVRRFTDPGHGADGVAAARGAIAARLGERR